MGKRNPDRRPVIEDSLYGYQPKGPGRMEMLVIVHHWSGLPDHRHAISVTYAGGVAGPGQRKNATNSDNPTRATERFGRHLSQFLNRKIVVDERTALAHYERLTGPHTACPECGYLGPIGAIFCGGARPLGRPDKVPPPPGCGARFKTTPARQAINA